MSGIWKSFADGSRWIGHKIGFGNVADNIGPYKPALPAPPGIPTVDTARQGQQLTDALMRRKGALANIFGGNVSGAPPVGKTTLGGS